nr:MAG TPA: hypothetical protein [Caudoviricetes sp.]
MRRQSRVRMRPDLRGQSHGKEPLHHALELNSNRFYKKKGDN